MGGFVVSPFLLSRVFGYGITATSLIMVGRPIAFSLGAWWSGRIAHRLPAARTAAESIAVVAVALFATGLGAQLEMVVVLIVAMTITGLGMGFGRPVVMTAVSRTVADRDLGVASGTYQMVVTLGSAIGISTLTTIIGDSDDPARFFWVFALAAAVAVVAAVGTHVAMHGTVDAPTTVRAAAR
jgi:MFS family permease